MLSISPHLAILKQRSVNSIKDVGESLWIISYWVPRWTSQWIFFSGARNRKGKKMLLSFVFVICLVIAATTAEPPPVYGPPGFASSSYRAPSFGGGSGGGGYGGEGGAPEPFNFKYEVKDAPSGNDYSHQASSDGRRVQGEYRVLLPDGRRQIVKYTADDNGYNADVHYEGQAKYPQGGGGGGGSYSSGGGSGGFGGYHY